MNPLPSIVRCLSAVSLFKRAASKYVLNYPHCSSSASPSAKCFSVIIFVRSSLTRFLTPLARRGEIKSRRVSFVAGKLCENEPVTGKFSVGQFERRRGWDISKLPRPVHRTIVREPSSSGSRGNLTARSRLDECSCQRQATAHLRPGRGHPSRRTFKFA